VFFSRVVHKILVQATRQTLDDSAQDFIRFAIDQGVELTLTDEGKIALQGEYHPVREKNPILFEAILQALLQQNTPMARSYREEQPLLSGHSNSAVSSVVDPSRSLSITNNFVSAMYLSNHNCCAPSSAFLLLERRDVFNRYIIDRHNLFGSHHTSIVVGQNDNWREKLFGNMHYDDSKPRYRAISTPLGLEATQSLLQKLNTAAGPRPYLTLKAALSLSFALHRGYNSWPAFCAAARELKKTDLLTLSVEEIARTRRHSKTIDIATLETTLDHVRRFASPQMLQVHVQTYLQTQIDTCLHKISQLETTQSRTAEEVGHSHTLLQDQLDDLNHHMITGFAEVTELASHYQMTVDCLAALEQRVDNEWLDMTQIKANLNTYHGQLQQLCATLAGHENQLQSLQVDSEAHKQVAKEMDVCKTQLADLQIQATDDERLLTILADNIEVLQTRVAELDALNTSTCGAQQQSYTLYQQKLHSHFVRQVNAIYLAASVVQTDIVLPQGTEVRYCASLIELLGHCVPVLGVGPKVLSKALTMADRARQKAMVKYIADLADNTGDMDSLVNDVINRVLSSQLDENSLDDPVTLLGKLEKSLAATVGIDVVSKVKDAVVNMMDCVKLAPLDVDEPHASQTSDDESRAKRHADTLVLVLTSKIYAGEADCVAQLNINNRDRAEHLSTHLTDLLLDEYAKADPDVRAQAAELADSVVTKLEPVMRSQAGQVDLATTPQLLRESLAELLARPSSHGLRQQPDLTHCLAATCVASDGLFVLSTAAAGRWRIGSSYRPDTQAYIWAMGLDKSTVASILLNVMKRVRAHYAPLPGSSKHPHPGVSTLLCRLERYRACRSSEINVLGSVSREKKLAAADFVIRCMNANPPMVFATLKQQPEYDTHRLALQDGRLNDLFRAYYQVDQLINATQDARRQE